MIGKGARATGCWVLELIKCISLCYGNFLHFYLAPNEQQQSTANGSLIYVFWNITERKILMQGGHGVALSGLNISASLSGLFSIRGLKKTSLHTATSTWRPGFPCWCRQPPPLATKNWWTGRGKPFGNLKEFTGLSSLLPILFLLKPISDLPALSSTSWMCLPFSDHTGRSQRPGKGLGTSLAAGSEHGRWEGGGCWLSWTTSPQLTGSQNA